LKLDHLVEASKGVNFPMTLLLDSYTPPHTPSSIIPSSTTAHTGTVLRYTRANISHCLINLGTPRCLFIATDLPRSPNLQ
jgi:hypothetical protein